MMKCDGFQARLSAYFDAEAGGEEKAIRAHVEVCDACRGILDGFRHLSKRVREIEEEEPATLAENIRRRVREGNPRGGATIPKLAAAAVLLAALLWAVVLMGDGGDRAVRLSDLARGGLSETEQRILYGEPPAHDEWVVIVLSGGGPR